MEQELTGSELNGWKLAECIGHGKSALVFRAFKEGTVGAVKVLDRELVEMFGRDAQRTRVEREKSLVGKHHPHLIKILDAGEEDNLNLFFIVMEIFAGKNLAEALPAVPHDRVHDLIAQVASAAQFLEEELNLAHRDIKPENIGISDDFGTAVLFDLGVLRPVGLSTITDQNGQKMFVGTLQYSPPELLHREELDSPEGWRAVSFYQLGGVLHDLLTRKPLFKDDLNPYPHLVDVVSRTTVTIQAPGAAPELRMLAQDCLVKDPAQRLRLVTWERFQKKPAQGTDLKAAKERIAQRRLSMDATRKNATIAHGVIERRAVEDLRNSVERILRDTCKSADFPPFRIQTDSSLTTNLRLIFDPSRKDALETSLAIYVQGKVVDVPGAIVLIHAAAAMTTEPTALQPNAEDAYLVQIFYGVRADDVLAQRLAEVLFFALDATQEACAQGRANPAPEWLALPGGT